MLTEWKIQMYRTRIIAMHLIMITNTKQWCKKNAYWQNITGACSTKYRNVIGTRPKITPKIEFCTADESILFIRVRKWLFCKKMIRSLVKFISLHLLKLIEAKRARVLIFWFFKLRNLSLSRISAKIATFWALVDILGYSPITKSLSMYIKAV